MILDGYKSGAKVPFTGAFVDGVWLERSVAWAYYEMAKAAWADGIRIKPGLGFRDMEYQTELFHLSPQERKMRGVGDKVAKPGFSNHQAGKAIDFENVRAYLDWLKANAKRFGFANTVASEPWHWEYVGK